MSNASNGQCSGQPYAHDPGRQAAALPPEEFTAVLAEYFDWDPAPDHDARLVEDLGLDSLQIFELMLLLEDVGGHPVPDEVMVQLRTVGDVYDTYELYAGHR
jgi:acyl carrier protein